MERAIAAVVGTEIVTAISREPAEHPSAVWRIAGLLAQQAAEKALKAALIASSVVFPFIHGLRRLFGLLPDRPGVDVSDDDLGLLDPWVIDGRYAAGVPTAPDP